ncbi:MAG: hypothetical protein Q8L10_00885 [Candidatus Moranbacteria bacterium]|nr:hypothetical protein [Candidatus Moranbacteria bacterium]
MKKFLASLWREIGKPISIGSLALLLSGGLIARCEPEISKEEQISHQLKYFQGKTYDLEEYEPEEKFFVQVELQEIAELKMKQVLVRRASDNILICALAPIDAKFKTGAEVKYMFFRGRKSSFGNLNEFAVALPE